MSEANLNLNELCQEIGKLCKDFNDEWTMESKIQALSFMKQVLFEISPKSHSIKKKKEADKSWRMQFTDGNVYVATFFRSTPPSRIQPRVDNNNDLILTVEEALLLATVCLEKFVKLDPDNKYCILPPMAAAVFNMNNIQEIAKDLNISLEKVKLTIISSAIKSGFHLTHSSCAVAVVYAFYAIEDSNQRENAKAKIIETYARKGKHYKEEEFAVYRKHCFGIEAKEFTSWAFETFDAIQASRRNAGAP